MKLLFKNKIENLTNNLKMFKLIVNENVYIIKKYIYMAITIKEIAKKANVSIATVSRALNNDEKVKSVTRDLVVSIANDLNYNPNILARNFVKKTSSIIGLILPDIFDEFFTEIIKGVEQYCFAHGYYTLVSSSHSTRTTAEAIIDFMGTGLVGGIIMMAPAVSDEVKETLSKCEIPFVIINGRKEYEKSDTINIDNYNGAFKMVDYLINQKGYKRIAHVTGPKPNADAEYRLKGYIDAMKKNNIQICESCIVEGDFTIDSGLVAFNKIMNLEERPEVIFAANDMMAIGCYNGARKLKLKVPGDIAITGFDDIFMSQYLTPRLTTVKVPIYDIGANAAKMMLKRVNSTEDYKPVRLVIPTELIEGESC